MSLRYGNKFWYALSESVGTRMDASPRDLDLTPSGTLGTIIGPGGRTMCDFGAAGNNSLSRADQAELLFGGDWSISMWIRPTSLSGTMGLLSKRPTSGSATGQELSLMLSGGTFSVTLQNAAGTGVTTIGAGVQPTVDVWSHWVVTFDRDGGVNGAGRIEIWRNGASVFATSLVASQTPAAPSVFDPASSRPLLLGMHTASVHPYRGGMGLVGGWDRVLTAAEIALLYGGASGGGLDWPEFATGANTFSVVTGRVRNEPVMRRWLAAAKGDLGAVKTAAMLLSNSSAAFSDTPEPRTGQIHGFKVWARSRAGNEHATGYKPSFVASAQGWWGANDEEYGNVSPGSAHNGGTNQWRIDGGTAYQNGLLTPSCTITNHAGRYSRWANGDSAFYSGAQIGHCISRNAPMGLVGAARRAWITYATQAANGGSIRPVARSFGTGTVMGQAAALISTQTGADAVAHAFCDFTNTDAARDVSINPLGLGDTVAGEICLLGAQVEDAARTSGWSLHLGHGLGGQSMRTYAIWAGAGDVPPSTPPKVGVPATQLQFLLAQAIRLQSNGDHPRLLLIINERLNSRQEALASVGPLKYADGDSPEAYYDSLEEVYTRWLAAWTAVTGAATGLDVLIIGDHPVAGDAEMERYMEAMFDFASDRNCACANIDRLTSAAEIAALGHFAVGNTDLAHMERAGYEMVMARQLDQLLRGDRLSQGTSTIVPLIAGGAL